MPLFSISKTKLSTVDQANFSAEKDLHTLIEENLETVFGCRFVASEFPTGAQHAGRIDTLALSEDNNPAHTLPMYDRIPYNGGRRSALSTSAESHGLLTRPGTCPSRIGAPSVRCPLTPPFFSG